MPPPNLHRPDPDTLLAKVQAKEKQKARGKLKIYFGASAGVGKTYAMLLAAHSLLPTISDLLVGIVETHGRQDTESLLNGLTVLPRKAMHYHDRQIFEFDLDAALVKNPSLILIDELAHTNIPGSRHPKRWQDVDELRDAGINVFTTLNVQHLESLNDVVRGITGVQITETIPDLIFDEADEVVLVDLPAEELLHRLHSGYIYQQSLGKYAAENFFRKGNLIALRELALRRTAERVEEDVQAYRSEQSINAVWKIVPALLACIGVNANAEEIIRATAILAGQLNTEWYVLYVETSKVLDLKHRELNVKHLKLATDLGAKTAVKLGNDIALTIIEYARSHNFSKIILGRSKFKWFKRNKFRRIANLAPEFDLLEMGKATTSISAATSALKKPPLSPPWLINYQFIKPYCLAIAATSLTTIGATYLFNTLTTTSIALLFLLVLILVAIKLGRGPAVVATIIAVISFKLLFLQPYFSLKINNYKEIITLLLLLDVSLIIIHLTTNLRQHIVLSSLRENRARMLCEFASELSSAINPEAIAKTVSVFMKHSFNSQVFLLLPNEQGHLKNIKNNHSIDPKLDLGIAQWAFDHKEPAGIGTDTLPASNYFYMPLISATYKHGLLAIEPPEATWLLFPEQKQQLEAFAAIITTSLERIQFIHIAQQAIVNMEAENLRNNLLASLTPALYKPLQKLSAYFFKFSKSLPTKELNGSLKTEIKYIRHIIDNLLCMEKIQKGEIKLNFKWHNFTHIVNLVINECKAEIKSHKIKLKIAKELPLIYLDSTLITQVLANLFGNAIQHTPPGTLIAVEINVTNEFLNVNFYDNGPGFPPGQEEAVFQKFTRGNIEKLNENPGIGLGLSICRAVITIHNGTIKSGRSPMGGAAVMFSIPLKPEVDIKTALLESFLPRL